jgi:hypothetical protein
VSVEIRDVAERRLVTAIELLSPTNKQGDGRAEYLERRRKLLLSTAHLIEIDLLRRGHRVPMKEPLPPFPYFVVVSRADRRPLCNVWPVALDQRLPTIRVPLLPGDSDVHLDLQGALDAVYDAFAYAATIDYSQPPDVPFTADEGTVAARILSRRDGSGGV